MAGERCCASGVMDAYWSSGPLVIGTAALSFSFTALAVKFIHAWEHSPAIPPFETVCLSGLACLLALTVVVKLRGLRILAFSGTPRGALTTAAITLARSAFGAAATTCFYLSLQLLSLKDAVTLFFTSPIIASLLDWAINGRSQGLRGLFATALTLTGVVLVTQPPFLFGGSSPAEGPAPDTPAALSEAVASRAWTWLTTSGTDPSDPSSWSRLWSVAPSLGEQSGDDAGGMSTLGVVLALAAAVSNASGFLAVNLLQGAVHPLVVTWWYNLVLAAVTAIPLALGAASLGKISDPPVLPTQRGMGLVLCVGATQFAAQVCLNRGFEIESASRGAAINVLQVLFSFLLDVVVLGDVPSPLSVVGSALVAAGVLFVAMSRAPPQQPGSSASRSTSVCAPDSDVEEGSSDGSEHGGGGGGEAAVMAEASTKEGLAEPLLVKVAEVPSEEQQA